MLDIRALPKAHLRLHLTGAMRPATLAELADRYGTPAPPPSMPDLVALARQSIAASAAPAPLKARLLAGKQCPTTGGPDSGRARVIEIDQT